MIAPLQNAGRVRVKADSHSSLLRRFGRLWLCFAVAGKLMAQAPAACAKCHVEAATQPLTHMAHALENVQDCKVLIDHPLMTVNYGGFAYTIERRGAQSFYSVTDGSHTITAPIRWAMGASSAIGQTYILETGGQLYESRVSWFRELEGLGPTLGGGRTVPDNLQDAMGRLMSRDDKLHCFGCHATGAARAADLTLDKMAPGVLCSHCHTSTEEHLAAVTVGKGSAAFPAGLMGLRDLSAEQAADFCGRCHRTWAEIARQANPSVVNVRFQPYRLTGSKCFDPDDPRISCVACHDPHAQTDTNPAAYDAKCQACHDGGKPKAKRCTAEKNNCVTCHMPKIDLPGAHFRFSDHRIRIVKPGDTYPG